MPYKDPEQAKAYRKAYYWNNREKAINDTSRWRLENPEKRSIWNKQNLSKYRERHNEVARIWAGNHKEQVKEIQSAKRSRRRNVVTEKVTLNSLKQKAAGKCGICLESLDFSLIFPNPFSISIDHIIPLSLGGNHTEDNLQLAHLQCNTRKGASITEYSNLV